MKLRYARHTDQLEQVTAFYTTHLGLSNLGGFSGHNGYDGVFLGKPNVPWHLEFTTSDHPANHVPDPDDALVLYYKTEAELESVLKGLREAGYPPKKSRNPYWREHATEFADPDGFSVILLLDPAL